MAEPVLSSNHLEAADRLIAQYGTERIRRPLAHLIREHEEEVARLNSQIGVLEQECCSCPVCTEERAGAAARAVANRAREVLTNQLEIARRQRRVLELQLLEMQAERLRVERLLIAALALIDPETVSKLGLCPAEIERWKNL